MISRQQLRKDSRNKRLSLTASYQSYAAQQLVSQLSNHPKVINANHIAIYLSNDGELNTTPFIQWCWANKKHTYLPVIHPFSKGHLLFLAYNEHTVMTSNKYGILEPKLNVNGIKLINNIDVIFTPLVAFDNKGERLGMGGGFYDRTLKNWHQSYQINKQSLPYPIGLAHECQQIEKVPTEPWDIAIPEIITPSKKFIF